MGTLGLAWTGDLKNAGGVCEKNGVTFFFLLFLKTVFCSFRLFVLVSIVYLKTFLLSIIALQRQFEIVKHRNSYFIELWQTRSACC